MERLLHDTTKPFKAVDYNGIEYTVCREYDYISRYRRLRQVIHYINDKQSRFVTNEIQNYYNYENIEVEYFIVDTKYENRLDLISYKFYNSASYSWILAYINEIEDAFTVRVGQVLMIPTSITELFSNGSILSSIPVTSLNLGTE